MFPEQEVRPRPKTHGDDDGRLTQNQQKTMVFRWLKTMAHGCFEAGFGGFCTGLALLRGVSGASLQILENHGISMIPPKSVKINQNPWKSTKINESQPKLVKINQNQWKSSKISENQPTSVKISENHWKSAKLSENARKWANAGENH
jgi:hypothetical protein